MFHSFPILPVILGNVAMLIADKAFSGNIAPTLLVSMFLVLTFAIAGELVSSDNKLISAAGYGIYILGFIFLPLAIMRYQQWTIQELVSRIFELSLATQLAFGFTILIIISIPILTAKIINEG